MELNELMTLADDALAAPGDDDAFLEKIEQYVSAFDLWFQKNEAIIKAETDPVKKEAFQELAKKHEAILALTAEAQAKIPNEIKNLKQKFRGIKAYIEYFPRSISVTKSRKG